MTRAPSHHAIVLRKTWVGHKRAKSLYDGENAASWSAHDALRLSISARASTFPAHDDLCAGYHAERWRRPHRGALLFAYLYEPLNAVSFTSRRHIIMSDATRALAIPTPECHASSPRLLHCF